MRRLILCAILLLILFSGRSTTTQAQEQARLVVFEAFTTESVGEAAGEAIDRLAEEYANRSVVFLEQDYDNPIGNRRDVWYFAHDSTEPIELPLVMVDSGHEIRDGVVSYYSTYKSIVDKERAREPDAEIEAISYRTGDILHFDIELTNLCGTPLSSSNWATVHAIVYEQVRDPDRHTGRVVRAAASTGFSTPLSHGATRSFALAVTLNDVDWTKIRPLVFVDYRPGGTGAYDMLQAAKAPITSFAVQPGALTFMVSQTDNIDRRIAMSLVGPDSLYWTSAENISWLTISPSSGPMTTRPVVSIVVNALSFGWQSAQISFTTDIGSVPVPVTVYYGIVRRLYLPIMLR